MKKAREIARRIQAGERVALRRWLRSRNPYRDKATSWYPLLTTTDALSEEVQKFGGNPEKIRATGRDRVMTLFYMEVQR